ncbi:MAG: lamin tail domain-containing protein [Desulfatibacillum sp.]|nr:lamin tail domain-containing protein [Desulfatibacillum sp.]
MASKQCAFVAAFLFVILVAFPCSAGSPTDFVVNEVHGDPHGDANGDGVIDNGDRFIELVNISSQSVDISGWTLTAAAGILHTFPPGTVIDPGYPVVVFEGDIPGGLGRCALFQTASSGSVAIDFAIDIVGLNDGATSNLTFGVIGINNGQSINRNPDLDDSQNTFYLHTNIDGANGDLFSPGTRINGFPFVNDCLCAVTCDMDEDGALGLGDALYIVQAVAGGRPEPGAYRWSAGEWSACSQTCGGGLSTRPVACLDWNGNPVDGSRCTETKPAESQACNEHSCITAWSVGQWSACSALCGGGTSARTVACLDETGNVVDDSLCSGDKPSALQGCNEFACSYAWNLGAWSDCSADCGAGTSTRTVTCRDEAGNSVADGFCPGVKPAASQICNDEPCAYSWFIGPWEDCSVACGGGAQTRAVTCRDQGGNVVDDGNCADAKPSTSQVCNSDPCVYGWVTGAWSDCSVDCGGGFSSRSVTCQDQSGNVVDAVNCTEIQPAASQVCNTQPCR